MVEVFRALWYKHGPITFIYYKTSKLHLVRKETKDYYDC